MQIDLNPTYRAEIDGLRSLAVLPVIFFHADIFGFSGGFLGVDVFFVISGYLIARLINSELRQGTFSIARFYERRVRRIFPALFVVMLFSTFAAWTWLSPQQFFDFGQGLISISLFVSNILFWQQAGYFATDASINPLLHTWSLSVEEQFYILFPILLIGIVKFGRRALCPTLAILAFVSFCLAVWITSCTAPGFLDTSLSCGGPD